MTIGRTAVLGVVALCLAALAPVGASVLPAVGPLAAASPGLQVDVSFFYDQLAPYGEWVRVSGPGWVWYPHDMQAGWRPYLWGRWVYSDYGWTWVGDEDWGWAVYHYGRWYFDPSYGWVWVPGTVWGPAWVAWHWGSGWVGWAPLPWQVGWRAGVGLDLGRVRLDVALEPTSWCFVESRYIDDAGIRRRVVPAARNVTLINVTQNITNYTVINNRVVNRGVEVERYQREVGRPVRVVQVREADSIESARGNRVRGGEVTFFRPVVAKGRPKHEPTASPRGEAVGYRGAREIGAEGGREGVAGAGEHTSPPPPRAPRPERETRRLDSYHAVERDELELIHEQETVSPPPGASQNEINRRQDAEHRAQQAKEERDRRVLEQRQRRETPFGAPPQGRRVEPSRPEPPARSAGPSSPGSAGPSQAPPRPEPAPPSPARPKPQRPPKPEKPDKPDKPHGG